MVPFEAFWMSSPQSSIAFCSGCDGGTQCDSFSSKVLSCADAVPRPSASPSAASPQSFKWRVPSIGVSPCDLVANRTFPFNRRKKRLYMFNALPCRGGLAAKRPAWGSTVALPHPPRCARHPPPAGEGKFQYPELYLVRSALKSFRIASGSLPVFFTASDQVFTTGTAAAFHRSSCASEIG